MLVTGAAGFAGRHLVSALAGRNVAVVGAGHGCELSVDFRMADDVRALLADVRPTVVYHLAGTSTHAEMARDPEGGSYNIVQPAIHVMEGALAVPGARVVLVSTCDVYGRAARVPTDETCVMAPVDLFGAARAAVEYMTRSYLERGLPVVVARAFHHTGPGGPPPLGDPELRRDYSDVRDIVEGYILLGERGVPGDTYNLCSGQIRSVRAWRALLGVAEPAIVVAASTVPTFFGSPAKAEALGWRRLHRLGDAGPP